MGFTFLYFLFTGVYCEHLLMSTDKGVYLIDAINKTITMKMNLPVPIHSMDYHFTKGYIYYTNGSIFRYLISEGKPMRIISYPSYVFETNLAVDWIHDKIYWTICSGVHIYKAELDGDQSASFISRQQLQELNTEFKPMFSNNILIDPYEGLLFFLEYFESQLYQTNSIIRSDLKGKGLAAYFNKQLSTATSLAIDMVKKRIYFAGTQTGPKNGFLFSIDYNGKYPIDHYGNAMTFISPVYVSAGNIYMVIRQLLVNEGSAFLYKINLTSQSENFVMENLNFKTIYTIKSVSWLNQPTLSEQAFSRCDSRYCSFQCTALPTARTTCRCPSGQRVEPLGRTCKDGDGVKLLISNQSPQRDTFGIIEVLPLKVKRQFFAYDYQRGYIFFYSSPNNTIYSSTLSYGKHITKIADNIETLCAIEVDWVNNNLYWIDGDGLQLLSLYDEETSLYDEETSLYDEETVEWRHRRTIVPDFGTNSTCDIQVDPYEKYLFILQNGIIHRSNLRLNNTIAMAKPSRHKVTSFTIDIKQRKVFMSATDTGLAEDGYLASVSYDFSDMFIYTRKLGNIIDRMAIFDNIVYLVFTGVNKTYFYWSALTGTENQKYKKLFDPDSPITDLVVYHPRAQMSPEDQACQDLSCSHMCEVVEGGNGKEVACRCPRNQDLDKDGKTCSFHGHEVVPGGKENENWNTCLHSPEPQMEFITYDRNIWYFISWSIIGTMFSFLTLWFYMWKNNGITWGRHRWEYRNNWWRRPETQREDNNLTSKIS